MHKSLVRLTRERIGRTMQLLVTVCWLLTACLGIEVFNLNSININNPHHLGSKEALAYFSDKFNEDIFKVSDLSDEFIEFINSEAQQLNNKPSLVLAVNGLNIESVPYFLVNDDKFVTKLRKLFKKSSKELTPEMLYFSEDKSLKEHFRLFNIQLKSIWSNYIGKSIINDKMFINELTQLIHLRDIEAKGSILFESNSLVSLFKKTGNSQSFDNGQAIFHELIDQLTEKFNVIIIKSNNLNINFTKRNQQLDKVFNTFRDSKKNTECFETEEDCQAGTSNCNSHGVCSKSGNKCYACICSSSFNKTTSSTTNWSGFDCSKKNISATANLLLWTTIGLLVLFIGGIKLLVSLNNEPLPNVLDAKI